MNNAQRKSERLTQAERARIAAQLAQLIADDEANTRDMHALQHVSPEGYTARQFESRRLGAVIARLGEQLRTGRK